MPRSVPMSWLTRFVRAVAVAVLTLGLLAVITAGAMYWHLEPQLPSVDALREIRLQVPLRVYSSDGALLAEFGEKRRVPLELRQIPDSMIKAVLASEDDRFYEHPGVDWQGLLRAVAHLVRTGEKGPGGSTITMQVARNFFLSREKTYVRKLNEILLALKIERELSKDEILELYMNKIFLGHRSYGVGAAAQVYYGKPIDELTIAQTSMIAGLPKAPSRYNPVANPARAVSRRNYVLGRMRELEFIDQAVFDAAIASKVTAKVHGQRADVESANYVAEMARAWMEERYGDAAYTSGYEVRTTLRAPLQDAAVHALRSALIDYDARHGYRGAEQNGAPPAGDAQLVAMLSNVSVVGGLRPAVVVEVLDKAARLHVKDIGEIEMPWAGMSWARRYISENRYGHRPKTAGEILNAGDLVRVMLVDPPKDKKKSRKKKLEVQPETAKKIWRLTQIPDVEAAFVAMSPRDGSIVALVGGFDFYRSKFNRVMQAERQPGSNFKPFVYSAAIEYGFNAGSIINDAPVVFDDPSLESAWRPENYSGKFFGPTRLREALYKSRNLVSIRLLRAMGIDYAVDYVTRFGFDASRLPRNLSLALGSATVKPIEVATGYAVIANGGYKVSPYLIDQVRTDEGELVYQATPDVADCATCEVDYAAKDAAENSSPGDNEVTQPAPMLLQQRSAPRVIPAENIWVLQSIMRDVVKRGTARRALVLKRNDLAGKTGTTNDQQDAWFSGFNAALVATAWVGFDKLAPMGRRETGGRAALPIWIDFMRVALDGVEEKIMKRPAGLVSVRINPRTGKLARADDPDAIFEFFHADRAPNSLANANPNPASGASPTRTNSSQSQVTKQLF
ncbi:MAG: penicillin-binding protein 1A [Gammaproteobacteria bacterium]|jgi:penicillin-binding protein 1A